MNQSKTTKSFFDLSEEEQKGIINRAAHQANEDQKNMMGIATWEPNYSYFPCDCVIHDGTVYIHTPELSGPRVSLGSWEEDKKYWTKMVYKPKTTKESDKDRLDKLFSFWESDLRYRIREEEKKYNNIVSIECGVDWVEMVIQKSLKDIIKESKSEIDLAYQQGINDEHDRLIKTVEEAVELFRRHKC